MNNASKGHCVTITPSGSGFPEYGGGPRRATEKRGMRAARLSGIRGKRNAAEGEVLDDAGEQAVFRGLDAGVEGFG